MSKKYLKKIAKEIAELELNHMKSKDPRIQDKIENIISNSKLDLFDLMELDEMIIEILKEKI